MREAVHDGIRAQFAEAGLCFAAQDATTKEEEGELPRAAMEDVD
jgi:hypothetical protein